MKLEYADRVFSKPRNGDRVSDSADFVIVGTGPSGATAAQTLTRLGHDVIMIEEGRWVKAEEFNGRAYNTQRNCYREMGSIAAMGKTVIPLIQGRCVGGGSVINAAIVWRMPQDVYDKWMDRCELDGFPSWSELTESFEVLEKDLNVHTVTENALGRNNALLKEGADKLGISSRIIPRNERGCQGYAQCLTGCPIKAKQSTDLTYVPWSIERGARLYNSCRAVHIDVKNGRAQAVRGSFEDPLTGAKKGELVAHAKKGVIVCASPIQTPKLLTRSGIGLSSGHLGKHLMGHPGSGIMGVYDEEVRLWEGATQGWDSEHFRQSDGVKFEALSMPPDLMAGRIPGVGKEFRKAVRDYGRMVNVGCAIVSEAEGVVRTIGDSVMVSYNPTLNDIKRLKKGLRILAEIMEASGAKEILPGVFGLPPRLKTDQIKMIDDAPVDQKSYTMIMTHLFGTARMGKDPRKSVVDTDFQVHDTLGVYILDSSIFPTNLGVNPQHTIMGIAMAGAKRIAAKF